MKILAIDITGKCNFECKFCYQESKGKLSIEQIMENVHSNPDFSKVEIGGGEPFMHKGLLEILGKMVNAGKSVNISTNASIIPEEFFGLEASLRDKITMQASLPAGNPGLYKKITGKNLFDLVLENIGRLKQKYIAVISSAIYADNFGSVKEILSLAYDFNIPSPV